MDKQEERKKPHGNPYPKRGGIKKQIIRDITGGGNDDGGNGNGGGSDGGGNGGGGGSGSTAAGYGADWRARRVRA